MKNIILIGPQGCGKGTQAEKMIAEYGLTHIEAGALIRARAKEHDKKADIIDHLANKKGQLLPDGVVLDMIYEELAENSSEEGYLFDGFPRTTTQYEALKQMLDQHGLHLTHCIYLSISDEESVRRLMLRGREDDHKEAIEKRLSIFHQTTEPVLALMESDGILIKINGEQSIESIFSDIKTELEH